MKFDDFVIQFSMMVLLACAAFFGVVAVAWYANKVLEARKGRLEKKAQAKMDSLVGKRFEVAVPPEPTVDERLKALEQANVKTEGSFKWLNDHGLERLDFEKRSKECLVEHRQLLDRIDERISKIERTAERVTELERNACARADAIEAKLSKLTQASDALDHWIHKIEGRVESIEGRLSGINKILDVHAEDLRERPSVNELGPIASQLEKLHESLVSHARDIDRLDGRIDTLAKRRAPKKRAR